MKNPLASPEAKSPGAPASVAAQTPNAARRTLRRRCAWALASLVIIGLAGWAVREPITAWMEAALVRRLHEQGIYPRYTQRSWLPWRGFRFDNVVLHRNATENHPVVELSEVTVVFPWKEIWRDRGMISHWRTRDARLTLHDDAGAISFDHVTCDLLLRGQQLEIPKLQLRHSPVSWSLSGHILLGSSVAQNGTTPGNFSVDLTVVRAVLARLDFRPDRGQFDIHGTFSMDFQPANPVWQVSLNGTGKAVEWEGVPLREATIHGEPSSNGIRLTCGLQFTKGSAQITVSRTDWDRSPVVIAGHFGDPAGHTDTISASYDHASGAASIATLDGPVNLLEFARNLPSLVPYLPTGISVRSFPEIAVKGVSWSPGTASADWSVGSVQVLSPADVTITFGGKPLTIDRLKGQATYQNKTWQIQAATGPLTWGDWTARSARVDGDFASTQVKFNSKLGLPKGSIDLTISNGAAQPASWLCTGALADATAQTDRFTGRYDTGSQTAVLTQLEGKANLVEFAANFRALAARLPKGPQIRTFPNLIVKDFSYRIGPKAESWSVSWLQLQSPAAVTVSVKGRPLVIDQLTGGGAFDGKVWRLANVAGQTMGGRFALDGIYENGLLRGSAIKLTKLRLEQFGPWIDAPQASLGDGLLSADYRGAVGSEAAQLNGSGSLQVENAPLVKVPLLDQTYDLFSALLPGVKRTGVGHLKTTFTVTNGVFTISQFTANGDSITVTAKGQLDLVQRQVSAYAWGNLRGVAGLATLAVSRTLEMKVSGPLDQIQVQSVGPVRAVEGTVSGAAKLTGDVLKTGVTMPLKLFDWLKPDAPKK